MLEFRKAQSDYARRCNEFVVVDFAQTIDRTAIAFTC
jgi:hypothetical protein